MKPEILVMKPIYAPLLAALERDYIVHKLWSATDAKALMCQIAPKVRALVITGVGVVTGADMQALPALEIVACFGKPHGGIDMAAARERGIIVAQTPDSITSEVADLAVGLLLSIMRRISEGDRFVRAGQWSTQAPPPGRSLAGKTCGIVGLGQIGLGIATRVEAFGVTPCYHGPRAKDAPYRYYPDLNEMAQAADCLIVSCPESDETRNLVDARILKSLGPDGFLVNVARGPVVDGRALIAALTDRTIAGAGLDVYWDEPRVPQALINMEHVVLAPHVGSNTREIRDERSSKLIANLQAHFAGRPVPYSVSTA
ncbi:MAG: 2-hydroxyacid dehydrogenase [Pseudomonadota bacterium]